MNEEFIIVYLEECIDKTERALKCLEELANKIKEDQNKENNK